MIKLRNITKKYGTTHAVNSTNLTIETGKTTVLIGPSGCGKSTLLRIIIGLISPEEGEVSFDGEVLNNENLNSQRQKMGYVIQEGGLFPNLSCLDNVTLMANYLSWKKEAIEKRLNELSSLTKLPKEALGRYSAQISGGQRQRVSLMRALMLDPDILLLDEPLGSLDPLIRSELQNDLKEIFTNLKKTVVMVTHDISEAAFFGDKIVLIKEGQIVQEGNISDLTQNPSTPFVTDFINAQKKRFDEMREM